MSNFHITDFRDGFSVRSGEVLAETRILKLDDVANNVGIEFGIVKLEPGGWTWHSGYGIRPHGDLESSGLETILIVLGGEGKVSVGGVRFEVKRSDVFSGNPWAFDIPYGTEYKIEAGRTTSLELALIRAENTRRFKPVILSPDDIPTEQRGKGLADGTMHREVKAIFGDPHAPARPKESNLVIGEVINFPGRWSSYPPHYHPQNEIYYYRFDKPQGFGVSVLNEDAFVVHTHDVVKIMNCVGHAQAAAPGYAMWYLWVVRQIDGERYEGNPPFTYFPEHKWVLDPQAKMWKPKKR